ncbi:ABC transporter permease [Polynucleobacter sp. SHI8]|uniref:ABC transporter permease n=1 Tax=unclassified Polynucleobacter TaxID=2640945 RepID=UPI0024929269|nr:MULTISPECIES: ABC transporter permease [unclassified Polynucleobacter]BDW10534.1 ABC transporter permease [Polynucleobacter sp. SHI2]BDW12980.1 ABC transporter permease [Polynucleobacter sp. SHI8]
MWDTIYKAFVLVFDLDPEVWNIAFTSILVSSSALIVGVILGLPIGAFLAIANFPGKKWCIAFVNTFMSVPTVVIGVLIYLLLSRSGPLGDFSLLFTKTGMIIAQSCLTIPIIAAVSRQIIGDAWQIHQDTFSALQFKLRYRVKWILWDSRFSLIIVILLGFSRAISEVGAVMIVGGNIAQHTRTLTTAIALETSKGDLVLSLSLGIVLLMIVFVINVISHFLKVSAEKKYG